MVADNKRILEKKCNSSKMDKKDKLRFSLTKKRQKSKLKYPTR